MRTFRFLVFVVVTALLAAGCSQFQAIFNKKANPAPRTAANTKKINREKTGQIGKGGVRDPIVTRKGTYYFVAAGDTLAGIAKAHKISREELAQINNLYDASLVVGRRLFIPNKKTRDDYLDITEIIKKKKMAAVRSRKTPRFRWPLKKYVLTSGFGWRRGRPHDGVDLSAKRGTPIYAAAAGRVIFAKRFSGYGNLIVLKHENNYFTAYAHADNILVKPGMKVTGGQQIATVGQTGRASGPHLHFEVRQATRALNPVEVLAR